MIIEITEHFSDWGADLLFAGLIFGAGMLWERSRQQVKIEMEQQREFDLGILYPVLGEWASGIKTREQADDEMRRSSHSSAAGLWFTMSEDERVKLGKRAVQLANDPKFVRKQSELMAAIATPTLVAEKAEGGSADNGDLVADMLLLKEVDPQGYQQLMEKLRKKAAENSG